MQRATTAAAAAGRAGTVSPPPQHTSPTCMADVVAAVGGFSPRDAPVCDAVRNMCLTAAETKVALSASPSSQSADGAAPTAKNPQAAPQPPPYPLANFSQSSNTTVGGGLGNFTRFEGGAAALAAARVTTAVAIMTSPLVLGLLGLGAGFSLL